MHSLHSSKNFVHTFGSTVRKIRTRELTKVLNDDKMTKIRCLSMNCVATIAVACLGVRVLSINIILNNSSTKCTKGSMAVLNRFC